MEQTLESFPIGIRWYVVNTKPKREIQSQDYLEQHGISTFLPWMEVSQLHVANPITKVKPLFPNYLFAQFDMQKSYPLVKWGKGVHHILGFGKYPTPIDNEVMTIIRKRTDENNIVKKAYDLKKNDHIRITSGPFRDLLAIFDRWVSDSGQSQSALKLNWLST